MVHAYRGLLHTCAVIAALLLGVTALLVTGDVVARNVGLGTLPWIVEVSEYVLPLATFLVAPWLLSRNEHVRLDVLLTALPPRVARALGRVGDGVGLAVSCGVRGLRRAGDRELGAAGLARHQVDRLPGMVAVRAGAGVLRAARGRVRAAAPGAGALAGSGPHA